MSPLLSPEAKQAPPGSFNPVSAVVVGVAVMGVGLVRVLLMAWPFTLASFAFAWFAVQQMANPAALNLV